MTISPSCLHEFLQVILLLIIIIKDPLAFMLINIAFLLDFKLHITLLYLDLLDSTFIQDF